jgi:predicted aldo/keto reductase-like oxidoreductase
MLLEAMRRFDFDTVLVALNVADVHRSSFARTVLRDAARRGMGVIGMKVFAAGALVEPGGLCTPAEAMHYVLSLAGVSIVIIGCRSPAEVAANVRAAREFSSLPEVSMGALEQRVRAREADFTSYKRAG